MAHWEFNTLDPSGVEQEITQVDQFNNDDVGLAEALVREVIQNSLDARHGAPAVKVRFAFVSLTHERGTVLSGLFDDLKPHLEACGIDSSALADPSPRLLVIEDFNTTGLTGRFDTLDDGHFRNFWRRHGRSSKGGKEGGRWGLGKLVFSCASRVRSFFGLTIRPGDPRPLLMGQAVLANHRLNGRLHPPHGFWFERRAENEERLQLPVTNVELVSSFRSLVGLMRSTEPGLSIVIPYVNEGIDEEMVLAGVVNNYYFPILAGHLVVEVGNTVVDRSTFRRVAAEVNRRTKDHVPFDFVRAVSDRMSSEADYVARRPVGNKPLEGECFSPEDLEAMKERYVSGDLVHVRVPVALRPKSHHEVLSHLDLFLRPLQEGEKSFALFARGPITLPGERRFFGGSAAMGALVAYDDAVAEFLGDAENPAHTGWNSRASKLAAKWVRPELALRHIRYSLRDLFGLIGEEPGALDEDVLVDFFALAEQGRTREGKRRESPKPKPNPVPREKSVRIKPRKGGFEVVAGPGAASWSYPRTVRVRVAYDMIGANPFKRHSKFDFDLTKKEIEFTGTNVDVVPVNAHTLKVTAKAEDFRLLAEGFDEKRDLVVEARAAG